MPPKLEVVTDRYARVVEQLGKRSALSLLRLWDSLTTWSESDSDIFHDAAQPFIRGAAQAAVTAAETYGATLTADPLPTSALIVEDAAARAYDPFDRLARLLSDGLDWTDAVAGGRSAARALGHDTVYRSTRQALAEIVGDTVQWQRRVTSKSCKWCLGLSDVIFDTAGKATFGHDNCDCIAVPSEAIGRHNARIRENAGFDTEAAKAERAQHDQRKSLEKQFRNARARSLSNGIESTREPDKARRQRLITRQAEWKVRAERLDQQLQALAA